MNSTKDRPQLDSTINVVRGTDIDLNLTFLDANGAVVNITGATVFFTVKEVDDETASDANALISKTVTSHTDPAAGETTISLANTDTNITPKLYWYDIRLKTSLNKINQSLKGNFFILSNVTRRTS